MKITNKLYPVVNSKFTGTGWTAGVGLGISCEPLEHHFPNGGLCPIIPGSELSGPDLVRWGNPLCRFKVVHKLGWGADSTVWVVQDEKGTYFVLKALMARNSAADNEELRLMKKLDRLCAAFLYTHPQTNEAYLCLVMRPMGMALGYFGLLPCTVESIAAFIRTLWDQVRGFHGRGICHGGK